MALLARKQSLRGNRLPPRRTTARAVEARIAHAREMLASHTHARAMRPRASGAVGRARCARARATLRAATTTKSSHRRRASTSTTSSSTSLARALAAPSASAKSDARRGMRVAARASPDASYDAGDMTVRARDDARPVDPVRVLSSRAVVPFFWRKDHQNPSSSLTSPSRRTPRLPPDPLAEREGQAQRVLEEKLVQDRRALEHRHRRQRRGRRRLRHRRGGLRCVLYKSFSPIAWFQHLIASPFN